jgi:hypothetical protein
VKRNDLDRINEFIDVEELLKKGGGERGQVLELLGQVADLSDDALQAFRKRIDVLMTGREAPTNTAVVMAALMFVRRVILGVIASEGISAQLVLNEVCRRRAKDFLPGFNKAVADARVAGVDQSIYVGVGAAAMCATAMVMDSSKTLAPVLGRGAGQK